MAGTNRNSRSYIEGEFTAWLSVHQRNLTKCARVICFDRQNADDVLQEALADIYQRWTKIRDHENLEAYTVRVMVSKHADLRRKWARRQTESETTLEMADFLLESVDNSDEVAERLLVQAALKSLTASQRAVLLLAYEYGYLLREIAEILDMQQGTVASHLARGKAAVAQYVESVPALESRSRGQIQNSSVNDAQIIEDAQVIEE
jgi:RNA polymerase sigma factor (sigma-70 family)